MLLAANSPRCHSVHLVRMLSDHDAKCVKNSGPHTIHKLFAKQYPHISGFRMQGPSISSSALGHERQRGPSDQITIDIMPRSW